MLALWATLAFIPAWWVQHAYQNVIGGWAAGLVTPPDSQIEFVELEIFYPFDLGVYVALCLASVWVGWRRRFEVIAMGLPILVLIELVALALAMKILLVVMMNGSATPAAAEQANRLATGIIRVVGLIAAAGVWVWFLGREQLALAARTWLPDSEPRRGRRHR